MKKSSSTGSATSVAHCIDTMASVAKKFSVIHLALFVHWYLVCIGFVSTGCTGTGVCIGLFQYLCSAGCSMAAAVLHFFPLPWLTWKLDFCGKDTSIPTLVVSKHNYQTSRCPLMVL